MSREITRKDESGREAKRPNLKKLSIRYIIYFIIIMAAQVVGSCERTSPRDELEQATKDVLYEEVYSFLLRSNDPSIAQLAAYTLPEFESGNYKYHSADMASWLFQAFNSSEMDNQKIASMLVNDVVIPLQQCVNKFFKTANLYNLLPDCFYTMGFGNKFTGPNKTQYVDSYSEKEVKSELERILERIGKVRSSHVQNWIGPTTHREVNRITDIAQTLKTLSNTYDISCNVSQGVNENISDCTNRFNNSISEIHARTGNLSHAIATNTPDVSTVPSPWFFLIKSALLALVLTCILFFCNYIFGVLAEREIVMAFMALFSG